MINYCIQMARSLSLETHRHRLYAVIVDKKGRVLTEGSNSYEHSCQLQRFYAKVVGLDEKVFSHAEINCLRQLKPYHKPDKIYVARVGRSGNPLNSMPCKICAKALKSFKIKKIECTL